MAACGGTASSPPTPTSTPFRGSPRDLLLRLQDLPYPGFTQQDAPHDLDAGALAGGDAARATRLRAQHLQAAAAERFFREVPALATSNGPVDIVLTVERFAAAGDASAAFDDDARRRAAEKGVTPTSAGPLGDEAVAATQEATAPDDVPVIQVTVEWRVANVVEVLVVRGRVGGTGLTDALAVAHRAAARLA